MSASECSGTEVFEANADASVLCCCTPYGGEEDGEGTLGACEGAEVPTGTGDAGIWCSEHVCTDFYECCDNYWNSIVYKMYCGCTYTFWCQENFDYAIMPGQCECPPHTHQQAGEVPGFFVCVITQG